MKYYGQDDDGNKVLNDSKPIATHNIRVSFGKHRGDLFTLVPLEYLKWMVWAEFTQCKVAQAEISRRESALK